ncbi:MAG: Gfo/Idh/MocA family protein, partial [Arenibacterium sp.]
VEQALSQAELVGIADPSDMAQQVASDAGATWFADPEQCLAQTRPDGVVIATPNHLHAEHALQCIAASVPCLVEKPIADSAENAARIVSAAEQSGVPVLIGHHRRHNPIVARAKEEIVSGRLGEIVAVSGQFWLYKPQDYFETTWRKGPGAGPTMINFIHDVDLLRHFCGNIVEVQAMRSNRQRGQSVEDTAAILMRFETGVLGTFSLSDTVVAPWSWEMSAAENPIYPHHPGSCYQIGGTHGGLSVPDLKLWTHDGPRSWWNPISAQTLGVTPADAFARQFSHFLDVINGATPRVSAAEGAKSLAAVLDVLQAGPPEIAS